MNLKWNDIFRSYTLKHLNRSFSDHSPLFLTINFFPSRKKSIFRFENFWFDLLGCHNVVRDTWNFSPHGNPMHAFFHLLSRTRYKLISWHSSSINNIDSNLKTTENNISNLELSDLNPNSQIALMDHYAKLSALQRQCHIKWAQRARFLWVKDGDRNTRFFPCYVSDEVA